tara:strand:+ start:2985 stop:4112 length:1128 start_codon:yes stop_codon:yes gene_type:complete
MHYFTFADKDSTLYEVSSSMNSGLDEILEVRKDVSDTGDSINVSRIVIKFDLTEVSKSIVDGRLGGAIPKFFLNLYDAKPTALATSQSLYAYPVSQSWTMGDGRSYDDPIVEEGCSWYYRNGETDGTLWGPTYSGSNTVSSSGGAWISGSGYEGEVNFTHKSTDFRMDVTDIVDKWLSGSISNYGFMVKRSGSVGNTNTDTDEGSTDKLGNFSFFSSDTHTKYPPTLETVWYDSKWDTGSLDPLTSTNLEDMIIYMKGLRPEYKENSKVKFRVVGKERFPSTTYSTTPAGLTIKYLPSGSSFYSIKDAETNDVIVPFSTSSLISCDSSGNYFNLDLEGYQPERYYSLEFRIQSGSNTVDETDQYFDEGFTFKVSI